MTNLKLYTKESCPYCIKVMNYMEEHDISVELADIVDEPRNREDLQRIGGKVQVPMLLIGDEPMYESDDIIEWFKHNR